MTESDSLSDCINYKADQTLILCSLAQMYKRNVFELEDKCKIRIFERKVQSCFRMPGPSLVSVRVKVRVSVRNVN